jgi:hypothetical protein
MGAWLSHQAPGTIICLIIVVMAGVAGIIRAIRGRE